MPVETLRILLVDTQENNYRVMADLLQLITFPYQLEWANSFAAAQDAVSSCRHDVLLVAYQLAGQTCLDLLRHGQAVGCRAPVIIMTDQEDREQDMQVMQAGAADYLIKGEVTASLLERSIRYAIVKKRAEDALRKSEERLAAAQRIAHVGNWDWHIETGELHWSDEIFRIFGYEPGAFVPTYEKLLQLVHPADKHAVNRAINEALYEQKLYQIEHRIVLADGRERVVAQQGEVTFSETGKPARMVGTVQDITSRRQADEALRLLEEKFSKAFLSSPDWFAISRAADGRYIEVNQTFLDITGYSREEVIGHTSIELGIWVDPKERITMLRMLDEHCAVRNLEVRFRIKSGDVRTMLWSTEVIDYNGEACLIVVAHDVTEKRQLENDLLKSQAKLYQKHEELKKYFAQVELAKRDWERTMDCIGDMVILGDQDGRIKRCNKAFQEFVNMPYDQIIGADWADLLYAHELITGTIFLQSLELYHQPTGRWFVLNPYQFNEGEHGEIAGTVITIHDTTELKQVTEKLEHYRVAERLTTTVTTDALESNRPSV
jgi:PAS domain S-box-containing protein